ncbi:MAG: hypothetical protein F9K47_01895 [Burkholderiales bacterium]|nr:MAG: hypothetical protein F9K47_01895 [Burkholderiales bacterium]
MTASTLTPSDSAPWHLWLIGILALLWNGMGAFDYLMTQTRNASYMAGFAPEQLDYFYGLPKWSLATWAISVWSGVLASVLLLLRRRWAKPAFAVSLLAMLPTFVHNYLLSKGYEIMGGAAGLAFTLTIVAVGIGLLIYSGRMVKNQILR